MLRQVIRRQRQISHCRVRAVDQHSSCIARHSDYPPHRPIRDLLLPLLIEAVHSQAECSCPADSAPGKSAAPPTRSGRSTAPAERSAPSFHGPPAGESRGSRSTSARPICNTRRSSHSAVKAPRHWSQRPPRRERRHPAPDPISHPPPPAGPQCAHAARAPALPRAPACTPVFPERPDPG